MNERDISRERASWTLTGLQASISTISSYLPLSHRTLPVNITTDEHLCKTVLTMDSCAQQTWNAQHWNLHTQLDVVMEYHLFYVIAKLSQCTTSKGWIFPSLQRQWLNCYIMFRIHIKGFFILTLQITFQIPQFIKDPRIKYKYQDLSCPISGLP